MASKAEYQKLVDSLQKESEDLAFKVAQTSIFKKYKKAIEDEGFDPDTLLDLAEESNVLGLTICDNAYSFLRRVQEAGESAEAEKGETKKKKK